MQGGYKVKFNLSKSKETGVKFIGSAVILGLVAAGGTYFTISTITAKVPVYAAKGQITKGDPLSKDLFNVVYLPKGGVPKDALTPSTNLGTKITNVDMSAGDVLRGVNTTDLQHENPSLLSARLRALEEKGLVGGEIPIDSVKGMLNGMKAGDRVYLVGVKKNAPGQASSSSNTSPSTGTVQGSTVVDSATVVGVRSASDGNAALVIAMSKQDAIKVSVAREEGKVYAYLLPFGDNTDNNNAAASNPNTNNGSQTTSK